MVYVDTRALRNDRVTLVERGAPHSICLMESGKLLPGNKVIIANPDTKGHCGDSNLGEVGKLSCLLSLMVFCVFFFRFGFSLLTVHLASSKHSVTILCTTNTSTPNSQPVIPRRTMLVLVILDSCEELNLFKLTANFMMPFLLLVH